MIDKSIPHCHIIMKREKGSSFEKFELPDKYSFVLFKAGDEKSWATIEKSAGEFDTEAKALLYFQKEMLPYKSELERRCIFIENEQGRKVATFSCWWGYSGKRRDLMVHWVAVHSEYQGLGLGKAIVCEGMKRLIEIEGDRDVYLNTQTGSYKAINIYIREGFRITDERNLVGYENKDYDKALEIIKDYLR